jgi:hypothetical protein
VYRGPDLDFDGHVAFPRVFVMNRDVRFHLDRSADFRFRGNAKRPLFARGFGDFARHRDLAATQRDYRTSEESSLGLWFRASDRGLLL